MLEGEKSQIRTEENNFFWGGVIRILNYLGLCLCY